MKWSYIIVTALVAIWTGSAGIFALSGNAEIRDTIVGLGYPPYFVFLLGVAKTSAAIALILPVGRTLREWAYAGTIFETLASASSYALSGAPLSDVATALAIGLMVLASYLLWRRTREYGPKLLFYEARYWPIASDINAIESQEHKVSK